MLQLRELLVGDVPGLLRVQLEEESRDLHLVVGAEKVDHLIDREMAVFVRVRLVVLFLVLLRNLLLWSRRFLLSLLCVDVSELLFQLLELLLRDHASALRVSLLEQAGDLPLELVVVELKDLLQSQHVVLIHVHLVEVFVWFFLNYFFLLFSFL